jgi:hypothetical protein
VVLDVDPVAHVQAVAVDGEGLALERVQDHEGDQLLGELVRAVVVRAAGDDGVHPVRVVKRHHEVVGGSLAGGVGAARRDRRRLLEGAGGAQASVDLVGRNLHVPPDARGARRLQQAQRPGDVRVEERLRGHDAAVDVALGGEVDDRLDRVALHQLLHRRAVPDVPAHEDVSGIPLEVAQVLEIPGVGQGVDVHHQVFRVRPAYEAHVLRPDEAGAASHEQIHGLGSFRY